MILNMIGGGNGGTSGSGVLTVIGVANSTVTVTKDTTIRTKTMDSSGKATFTGLEPGSWTVEMSNGSQTATKTVTITTTYSVTLAYFAATISITYPAESTCVVTDSGGETVASNSNTGSSAKTWTATVNATGTYTITATATDGSGKSKSTTVSITADGQSESVTLTYELVLFESGTGAMIELETYHDTYGTISITDDAITIDKTKNIQCEVTVRSVVLDLSEYNTLEVIINVSSIISDYPHNIGVVSETAESLGGSEDFDFISYRTISNQGEQTINIPVSSIDRGHFAMGGFIYGTVSSIKFKP